MPRYGPYSLLFQQFGGAAFGLPYGTVTPDRDGFSLDAFLAGLSDGFAFDFTKTDRHFQTSAGPTLADDVTDPIGLALESRQWNGRTLAEELATQEELRGNAVGVTIGTPPSPTTYNPSTGEGSISRGVDASNQGYVQLTLTGANTEAMYRVDVENTSGDTLRVQNNTTGTTYGTVTAGNRAIVYALAPSTNLKFTVAVEDSANFIVHSVKLVPTHHGVQSSSSLRGARAVFYGYSDDQAELVPEGDWTALSGGILSAQSQSGFRLQSGGADTTVMAEKSYDGFEIGATYRVQAVLSSGNADASRLRVGTESVLVTGAVLDDNAGAVTSKSWALTFTATAETLYFGIALVRAAFSADATISGFSIKKIPASRITTGCKYDGSDDNHLTTYKASVQVGPELVTNGTFAADANWTKGTGWTIGSGVATKTAGSASSLTSTSLTAATIGRTYRIDYTITVTAGTLVVGFASGGGSGANRTASGTYTDYITATAATAFDVSADATFAGTIDNVSVKEVTNQYNFIVAYVNVPTTISAVQIVAGANEAASANRFFLAFNTSGQLCGGVGSESNTTILSTATDWRGKSAVFGLSFDGTTVRMFADGAIVYEAAQSGAPTTTIPFRIGANNADGTAGSYFSGTIENVIAGPEYLNLARYLQIRNDLINQ